MVPVVYLQGRDWHITAAEELAGKDLSNTQKVFNLQEQAASARTVLEHFAQSMAILALEVEEAHPVEKIDAAVRPPSMLLSILHTTLAEALNIVE